jgi:IS5 family transposase
MQTDEGKRLYKARAGLAELPNAHAKDHFGLDRVLVRGLEKVGCVGLLAALAFNLTQHAARLLV